MPKRLTIDFEEIQMAFEDRDGDGQWFLDRDTGDVIRLTDDEHELAEQVEDSGERYIGIPYQGSEAGYRDMAEFIGSVDDNRLHALLDTAIQGGGAFRRFKDVLRDYPQERERWFAFQKQCVHRRIRRWLESEHIEAVPVQRAN
ncbi:MAG TPA: UPF0158 family protein [Kofleriaceae bacterium]